MLKINKSKFYICVFIVSLLLVVYLPLMKLALAQSCPANMSTTECTRLTNELKALEKEIAEWQKILDETRAKKNTLAGDVSILNAQIAKAEKEIKQRNITLTTLNVEINQKVANINSLESRIVNNQKLLANLLKKKAQNEVEPVFYLLLSAKDLSDMIVNTDEINMINQGLQDLFAELRGIKTETQKEKEALDKKKNQELDAKYEVEIKKKTIAKDEAEKKELLNITTKVESNYQQVLSDRQRKAEAIRSALFDLRDADGISFAKALEYATWASEKTGVRTAFILAILSQESDLGKNVGTCNRAQDPADKKWNVIMPGPNDSHRSYRDDQTIFLRIMKDLNLDPNTTPLSCPWGNGWGGAMGPSQFIPTTWAAYEAKIAAAVGVKIPNPWNPQHAIMATAIYMNELGASAGGYTAERTAALKYYAGGNWNKPANAFYGNQVIAKAEKFQADIDFLKNI